MAQTAFRTVSIGFTRPELREILNLSAQRRARLATLLDDLLSEQREQDLTLKEKDAMRALRGELNLLTNLVAKLGSVKDLYDIR